MKKNFIYITTLLVLTAVVFILLKKPVRTTEVIDSNILKADSLQIIEIIYEHNGTKILIAKGFDKWQIREPGNFEPDPNAVRSLIQFVSGITLKNVISEKPEKFSKFAVDSTGIVLTVRKEDNSRISYIIGTDDVERNYSFYRIPNDNRVFIGTLFPRYRLTSELKSWRNRMISQFNQTEINSFSIRSGSELHEFSRNNDGWKSMRNGTEIVQDQEKITNAVNKLSAFSAVDFLDAYSPKDYTSAITLYFEIGNLKYEIILTRTSDGLIAYRKDNGQTYIIQESDYAVFENILIK